MEFKTPNQVDTFYDSGPYRSSDHDPLIVGLDLTTSVRTTRPAHVWLGLKNSDDQGTRFDVRVLLRVKGGLLVAEGVTRCVTGITRNPASAKEVSVPFGAVTPDALDPGDEIPSSAHPDRHQSGRIEVWRPRQRTGPAPLP